MLERRILAVSLAVAASVAAPGFALAQSGDRWGSIVFSQDPDGGYAWGIAWSFADRQSAANAAMGECRGEGGSACSEAGWFRNTCGALAIGDDNGMGTGAGGTEAEAERSALAECRKVNANCRVAASECAKADGAGEEDALGLDRDSRRRIQSALAARGFDPGAPDGVFGSRTRAAIRAWQADAGAARSTGYLSRADADALLAAAEAEEAGAAPAADGSDRWGSIAFSQEPDGGYAWGMSWSFADRESAANVAMDECRGEGGSACSEAGWFRNTCGALAIGDGNGMGTGGGGTEAEAERTALAECRKVNANCRVAASECSKADGGDFAGVRPAPAPAARAAGTVFRDCPNCPEMVVVPAGNFMMGSPPSEEGHDSDEGPVHRVAFAAPFAVGVFEVTFAEWDACVSAGGCGGYRPEDAGWGRGSRPVVNVSWDDAQSYVGWLSRSTGEDYRLLSESEWEYVARAGTSTRYWWGSDIGRGRANCDGCGSQWDAESTAPVGSFSANAFGLHDVHGNVWEWTGDCWNESYEGAPGDGRAWGGGECSRRVRRGGSWSNDPQYLRSAIRVRNVSGLRNIDLGFRVARTLTP